MHHCQLCRDELRQWQALGELVRLEAASRLSALPPLAPWLTTGSARYQPDRLEAGEFLANSSEIGANTLHQKLTGPARFDLEPEPAKWLPVPLARDKEVPLLTLSPGSRISRFMAIAALLVVLSIAALLLALVLKPDLPAGNGNAILQPAATARVVPTTAAGQLDLKYPGATSLLYNEATIKQALGTVSKLSSTQLKEAVIGFFATNDDYLKVKDYYKNLLTSAGYKIVNEDPTPQGAIDVDAVKGNQVINFGAVSPAIWATKDTQPEFYNILKQLQSDQTLIYYFNFTGNPADLRSADSPTPTAAFATPTGLLVQPSPSQSQ